MFTALAIAEGVFSSLAIEKTAYVPFSTAKGVPLTKPKNRIHDYDSFYKIYTGLDHGNMKDAGGDLPDIRMFDNYGSHIGDILDHGDWLAPGSSAIVKVMDKDHQIRQPIYTLFTANNNAICVALITTSFAGLGGHYAWLGDLGSGCVGDDDTIGTWYFGGIVVPGTNHYFSPRFLEADYEHQPNCLWIDADGGQPATAFQIKWPELIPLPNDTRIGKPINSTGMCQTPTFQIHNHQDPRDIRYEVPKTDDHGVPVKPKPKPDPSHTRPRRSVAAAASRRFQQKYNNMLVINDLDSQRAHTLCGSISSAGPNFLNPKDGFFCDMETKTVHPVCASQDRTTGCFDLEQNQLVGPGLQKRSVPYEVQDWRVNRGEWRLNDEE